MLLQSNIIAQTLAPCPPSSGANSIDLSNQFGSGSNTSSNLFANQNSGTFLDVNVTPISDNWWRNDTPPLWYLSAYNGNTTNIQLTTLNYPNQNPGKEIRITGDFIVDQSISIQYSEIKMSSGARIIVKSGSLLDLKTVWIHSCDENSSMWESILVEDGGYLRISGASVIEDGINAVYCFNNSFLDLNQVNFNKNYVGVVLDGPIVKGTATAVYDAVNIERVSFTCVNKSMFTAGGINLSWPYLPELLKSPYSNQRGYIGVLVKNVSLSHQPHVGTDLVGISTNYYVNLRTGIKCINSFAKIKNSVFYDIQPDQIVPNSRGKAIDIQGKYLANDLNTTIYAVEIGDTDPLTLNDKCTFSFVETGINVYGASDIRIYNTQFESVVTSPVLLDKIRGGTIIVQNNNFREFTGKGLTIRNCINNNTIEIQNNSFELSGNSGLSGTKFNETGIFITNTPIGYNGAIISNNSFTNMRFGIYGNGITDATITNNTINFDRSWTTMSNKLHAGIWIDNSDRLRLHFNLVEYNSTKANSVPAGSTIAQDLRGLVLKRVTTSTVVGNIFRNTGRPIRCVDDLSSTYFDCNEFDGSFDAWQFQNVDLSVQGGPLEAAGNIWKNYPRVNFSGTSKVAGYIISPTDYYYTPVTTGATTQIPLPNNCVNFVEKIATGTSPCQDQPLDDGGGDVLDFVLSDTNNISNDSLLSEERRRWAAFLLASDSLRALLDYQIWFQQMEGSEARIYSNLADPSYERSLIIEELQQLSGFKSPEFQYKRDLFLHAIFNQLSEEEEDESHDTLQLEILANTSAWSGTSSVFLSRAILSEEVDDEYQGLKLFQPSNQENSCPITTSLENHNLRISSTDSYIIELYSIEGQLMNKISLIGENLIPLSTIDQIGFYRVYSSKCTTTGKWIHVR